MENVRFEKEEHIGVIVLSRPEALNALNYQVLEKLDGIVDLVGADDDIYCLIITGEGEKSFVAGADISEMKEMDVFQARKFSKYGNKVFRKIELLDKPVIAAVNGYALGGGCELALCCDLRIASDNAIFRLPEVSLGIIPGFGGTQRLPRLIGLSKAKEMLFTGIKINAEEALRIGLVNKVVPRENLMLEVKNLADLIIKNAPIAVKNSKIAVNRGMQCDLDTAILYESEIFAQCFSSEDQKEAMNAFIEKRKVDRFKNR